MRLLYLILAVVLAAGVAGFGGYQVATRTQSAEIARIASVNVERSIRIRRSFEPKPGSDARDLLDAGVGQDLFYMQALESAALSDPSYAKQRARSVALVKQEWLERPPFALEDGTNAYINEVCALSKNCPGGDLKARKGQP
jgi:hypothetical protein